MGLALLVALAGTVRAQPASDSNQIPQFGTFVQVVAQSSSDSSADDGVQVATARVSAEGAVRGGLTYELEADVADGVALKDARLDARLSPALVLSAGQFKTPFSYGTLTSTAATPFVERPDAVNGLELGRRVGAMLAVAVPSIPLTVQGGVFNERPVLADADPGRAGTALMYVGRATWEGATPVGTASVGVNVGYGDAAAPRRRVAGFRFGADVHLERERAFLTAEVLRRSEAASGEASAGAYVTAGYAVAGNHRLRVRLDRVVRVATPAPAAARSEAASTVVGFGYTFAPSWPVRLEADVLAPASDAAGQAVSVRVGLQVNV